MTHHVRYTMSFVATKLVRRDNEAATAPIVSPPNKAPLDVDETVSELLSSLYERENDTLDLTLQQACSVSKTPVTEGLKISASWVEETRALPDVPKVAKMMRMQKTRTVQLSRQSTQARHHTIASPTTIYITPGPLDCHMSSHKGLD